MTTVPEFKLTPELFGRPIEIADAYVFHSVAGLSYQEVSKLSILEQVKIIADENGGQGLRPAKLLLRADRSLRKKYIVDFPGCSIEDCAEVTENLSIKEITIDEWNDYSSTTKTERRSVSRAMYRGANIEVVIYVSSDLDGKVFEYRVNTLRNPAGFFEKAFANLILRDLEFKVSTQHYYRNTVLEGLN